jgi:hypoxanthine phosphoribosyltransferase
MHRDIQTVLFDESRIRARVREVGSQITRDTAGKDLVLLALLKGGAIFLSDLMRAVDRPIEVDFAWVSSYGGGTTSSREVQLKVFPDQDLSGKTVVIVDDILDTGHTLAAVTRKLRELGAIEVLSCVLLDKPARREVAIAASYRGFEIENQFVVGYGLDYDGRYRNLPYIGVLRQECYEACCGPDA